MYSNAPDKACRRAAAAAAARSAWLVSYPTRIRIGDKATTAATDTIYVRDCLRAVDECEATIAESSSKFVCVQVSASGGAHTSFRRDRLISSKGDVPSAANMTPLRHVAKASIKTKIESSGPLILYSLV